VILTLAAVVRFWGISFGLPHSQARPDETQIIDVTLSFLRGNFKPAFYDYPWLYMWALTGLYLAYYVWGLATGSFQSVADLVASWPVNWEPFFLISRSLSAVAGVATVFVVYRLARRLWDEATALVAALFMALAFIHTRDSHFGTTDIVMTLLIVASVSFLVSAQATGRRHLFVLAGLFGGLATATKYSGAFLVAAFAVSHLSHAIESPGGAPLRCDARAPSGSACHSCWLWRRACRSSSRTSIASGPRCANSRIRCSTVRAPFPPTTGGCIT
jgi:4-amino-4-deoxy-L-arabinose transferase-like glycosyltransferase